jgi:hypothetical protein
MVIMLTLVAARWSGTPKLLNAPRAHTQPFTTAEFSIASFGILLAKDSLFSTWARVEPTARGLGRR